MIRLEHISKYYNKNKINQFLVCNDISLSFEQTGLIAILGPSGSGKTTLLNVISGMDRFDKGRLIFDDVVFDKYNHNRWDKIRKDKIGFVYQNYHLLKGISVYANIEPVFKMQGITDETAIRESVEKLLSAVNLNNFADRLVKQLSGGQQQRVAFARALANNPEVILADEPTGNLDGKSTIELMNVIKEISKTRLVIMVTHEQVLCDYYADRIIEIENGTIVTDYPNNHPQKLEYIQEHIINLSDFQKKTIEMEQLNINRYTNKSKVEDLNIDLIERNQTLYVKVHSKTLKRTKYIDDDSEIMIQQGPTGDETYKNPFNLEGLYPDKETKSGDVFLWKDLFRYAIRNLNIFKRGGKILFFVLLLVGFIIGISIGLLGEIYHVEEPYTNIDQNYITVFMDRTQYGEYELLENVEGVDQLMLVNEPYPFKVTTPKYYEIRDSIDVVAQPIDIKFFDESTLIYGNLPEEYEIIIDQSVAEDMIANNSKRGIQTYDDVLNCQFKLQTSGYDTSIGIDTALYFNISGIAQNNSKSVWMKEELLYSIVTPVLLDYRIFGDNFVMVSGNLPDAETYVVLNENYPSVASGGIPYNIGISTGTYYISGIYRYDVEGVSYDFRNAVVTTLEYLKIKYFKYDYRRYTDFTLLVYAEDVKATLISLEEAGYTAVAHPYEPTIAQQVKLSENQIFYLLGLGGILMSAFSIFLIMRSSLITRLYEVSVYRSIGISRKEIRRIFLIEILLTTSLSSILGFLLIALLLSRAQASLEMISIVRFTGLTILISLLGLYAINILFGLIPINLLLRKTPSNIMTQNDL